MEVELKFTLGFVVVGGTLAAMSDDRQEMMGSNISNGSSKLALSSMLLAFMATKQLLLPLLLAASGASSIISIPCMLQPFFRVSKPQI